MSEKLTICFVCTGNTCRSIMAERLFKKMLKGKANNITVISRGLNASGENISAEAKQVLKKYKALSSDRKSVKLKSTNPKFLYVVLNDNMKPFVKGKVISFKDLVGKDIIDPYGRDLEFYFKTAEEICEGLEVLLSKILKVRGDL